MSVWVCSLLQTRTGHYSIRPLESPRQPHNVYECLFCVIFNKKLVTIQTLAALDVFFFVYKRNYLLVQLELRIIASKCKTQSGGNQGTGWK